MIHHNHSYYEECEVICSNGTRCPHQADYQGICRWHLIARRFSMGKVWPQGKISFWRFYVGVILLFFLGGALWKFLKNPAVTTFFPVIGMCLMILYLISLISCFTKDCSVFWPKMFVSMWAVSGAFLLLSGLIYLLLPDLYVELMEYQKLVSCPPRVFFSISTICFGIFFFMMFVQMAFYVRISPIVCVGFLIVGCIGTFVYNFSTKHPILSLSMLLGIIAISIYFEIKTRKADY